MNAFSQTMAGAGAQIAVNSIGIAANSANSRKMAEKQQEYNKELMKYQGDLQQQYIDKQNAYNSPSNQMKLLQEAGLNPNLAYGNLSSGAQSSAPKPTSSAPADFQKTANFENLTQYVDVISKFAQLQDTINRTKISNEQVKQIQAQTNLTDINAGVQAWKKEHMLPLYKTEQDLKNKSLSWDVQYKDELFGKFLNDLVHSDVMHKVARGEISRDEAEKLRQEINYYYSVGENLPVPRHLQEWILNQKHRQQAISNMNAQNELIQLQKTSTNLANNFTQWYNDYRMLHEHNLFTPSGPWGFFDNDANILIRSLYY